MTSETPAVTTPPVRKQRVMSGMRVTGRLHIGHYWGALSNWVQLQEEYECFFGAMDWHGMTTAYKSPKEIAPWTREMIAEFIAWGVDPERSTIFVQSHVPEHLELFMILANLTPMGWLERVNTWKDAIEEMKASDTYNLGRFAYPVLQAADILMYRAQKVPVGADQVAHLEISREIVRRFNHLYKAKLPEMNPLLTEIPLVPGLDGRKMSKSYNNSLFLTEDSEKDLKKKVNMMVTDPARVRREDVGEPTKCSVYGYHKLYSSQEDKEWVEAGCRSAGIGCGDCKGRLAQNIEKMSAGPREKKKELLNSAGQLDSIIAAGSDKARQEAQKTLGIIRSSMKW
ncbi:tryptophan--tRNA ligase [Bdellovibrio sp. HCB2-146]|uniref:tryptophan--tRNA ligase n=1 Tax=Bdellovibrio sp. HCB2-146 TaxID=3394362 RepID=UPI0039BC224F